MVENCAERTPPQSTMHVKGVGARRAGARRPGSAIRLEARVGLRRRPRKVAAWPPALRGGPPAARGRVARRTREFRAGVSLRDRAALEPLRSTGKRGGILMQ